MRHRNAPSKGNPWDLRFRPCRILYLRIFWRNKRSIGVLDYIPTCTSFLFLVGVSLNIFSLRKRPTSATLSHTAFGFWPPRFVFSAIYNFQSGHFDARSQIWVSQRSMRISNSSEPAPCMSIMLTDCWISQTSSLALITFHCIVKRPSTWQIPIVSAAHWLTPIPVLSAHTRTCTVGIWIVIASAMPDFASQEASHHILGSQRWSMIEWSISNACYSKNVSGVLNILSRVMRCGSRDEERVL